MYKLHRKILNKAVDIAALSLLFIDPEINELDAKNTLEISCYQLLKLLDQIKEGE